MKCEVEAKRSPQKLSDMSNVNYPEEKEKKKTKEKKEKNEGCGETHAKQEPMCTARPRGRAAQALRRKDLIAMCPRCCM